MVEKSPPFSRRGFRGGLIDEFRTLKTQNSMATSPGPSLHRRGTQ